MSLKWSKHLHIWHHDSHLNIQSSYQSLDPHLRQHEPFFLYFEWNNLSAHELAGFYHCTGIHTTLLKAFYSKHLDYSKRFMLFWSEAWGVPRVDVVCKYGWLTAALYMWAIKHHDVTSIFVIRMCGIILKNLWKTRKLCQK